MNRNQRTLSFFSVVLLAVLLTLAVAACGGTTSQSPSPSQSASAKPASSPSSSSPAAASPSASAKPATPEQQTYQKAQENWGKVLDAARKEEPAVIYAVADDNTLKKYQDPFNKIDPKIQVRLLNMTGAQATEKMKAEAATKQYTSNGYMGGSPSTRSIAEQGLGQYIDDLPALYEPGVQWVVPALLDKPKETLTYGVAKNFIMYNTNVVKEDEAPRTWRDLADPKWKGKLVLWDVRVTGLSQALVSELYAAPSYGPEVARGVIANALMVANPNEAARMVAKGEAALTVNTWSTYLPVKDAPIKMASTSDGTRVSIVQVVVAKTAPQLNTTKVFLNWLMGKEGQRVVSEAYSVIRADAVPPITKEVQIVGEKMFENAPVTYEFEMTKIKDAVKAVVKMADDLGK